MAFLRKLMVATPPLYKLAMFRFLIVVMAISILAGQHAIALEISPRTLSAGEMLRGNFIQDRKLAGFPKPLRSEGSFLLVPTQGLIWRGEHPFKSTTVISGDGILQMVDGQEAMRLSATRIPGLGQLYEVLGAALSGETGTLTKAFIVERTADAQHWQLLLTPRSNSSALSQLKSLLVKGAKFVETVEINKGDGDVDRLTLLNPVVSPLAISTEEKSLLGPRR